MTFSKIRKIAGGSNLWRRQREIKSSTPTEHSSADFTWIAEHNTWAWNIDIGWILQIQDMNNSKRVRLHTKKRNINWKEEIQDQAGRNVGDDMKEKQLAKEIKKEYQGGRTKAKKACFSAEKRSLCFKEKVITCTDYWEIDKDENWKASTGFRNMIDASDVHKSGFSSMVGQWTH